MNDEAILRKIGLNRDDDAPRVVYSDMLEQRGDPRGAFIQLQLLAAKRKLTPAERKRHDALLKEHKQRWLGPFAGNSGQQVFERGFLVELHVNPERLHRIDPQALEWLTVERARNATPDMGPQFHRLREMDVDEVDLLEGEFPELRTLWIKSDEKPARWRQFFASAERFPQLVELSSRGTPALFDELLETPLGRRLRVFTERESTQLLAMYSSAVLRSELKRFHLSSATLVRTAQGWELELRAPVGAEPLMVNVLSGLKPDGLTRLRLTGKWSPMHLDWARESIEKMPVRELFLQALAAK